ncbi:MAG: outer membrane beta-barrel protein [Spirochaetes bacterium]|nr:outer membrane beta-barrel protein [Spirochaetota bacterium]
MIQKPSSIIASSVLASLILLPAVAVRSQTLIDAAPIGGQESQPPPEKKSEIKQTVASARPAMRRHSVMLGIGTAGVYEFGGGENHDGMESAGINSTASLSASFFLIDRFALGLTGRYQYAKTNVYMKLRSAPLEFKATAKGHYGAVGFLAHYFFRASDRIFPYLGVFFHYAAGKLDASQFFNSTPSFIDFGAMAGMNFLVVPNLGIYLEISHTRDVYDPGGADRWGHLTAITLGFRIYL